MYIHYIYINILYKYVNIYLYIRHNNICKTKAKTIKSIKTLLKAYT